MTDDKVKVGVVGCGNICGAYFNTNKSFNFFDIVACADIDLARAREKADEYGIAKACAVDELLADPNISFVINLTIPAAHGSVALEALRHHKSVYNEKPLAVTRSEAQEMLQLANDKQLRVGCAPDTFLGGGLQTCRKLIDEGAIGQPVAATAFMAGHGPEGWHPNPEFFYKTGGGPMFDGTLLFDGAGQPHRPGAPRLRLSPHFVAKRTIGSQPLAGQVIDVEVATHVAGVMDFHSGAIATLIMSFDVWSHHLPCLEIHGTEGSMSLPDPNTFGGPVKVRRAGDEDWEEVPLTHGYSENSRGLGMADMALAMRSGRPHRASGEMAYHVLDLMHAFHDASTQGHHIEMQSTCLRPAALPVGLQDGQLDQ